MLAIFLDKDGTLIPDVPYNVDPAKISLMPGAIEGLKRLHSLGYGLVVVSNQSGVARGFFPESALAGVEQRLRSLLRAANLPLAGFYYCPHHPEGPQVEYAIDCDCRKPAPGLLFRAAADLNLNLSQSWMVGDILNDVEAGRRAGCHTILINNGNETEWLLSPLRTPHYQVKDLSEAATVIATASKELGVGSRESVVSSQ